MPFMLDVYEYASSETIELFSQQMEWFEEGFRAPMTSILALKISDFDAVNIQMQLEDWSAEECLDAVDIVWERPPSKRSKELLNIYRNHSDFCAEWVKFAEVSHRDRSLRKVKNALTSIYSTRDDLLAAMQAVERRPDLSDREKKSIRQWNPMGWWATVLLLAVRGSRMGGFETLLILKDIRLSTWIKNTW